MADKYIEFDPVILVLDLFLFRLKAYRHLLFNRSSRKFATFIVKLAFSEVLLDAREYPPLWGTLILTESAFLSLALSGATSKPSLLSRLWWSVCGLAIYSAVVVVLLRLFSLVSIVRARLALCERVFRAVVDAQRESKPNARDIVRGLVVSSYGRLLTFVPLIWNPVVEYSLIIDVFISFSNVVALTGNPHHRHSTLLIAVLH